MCPAGQRFMARFQALNKMVALHVQRLGGLHPNAGGESGRRCAVILSKLAFVEG